MVSDDNTKNITSVYTVYWMINIFMHYGIYIDVL